jgi:UDP-4-amino-4,6-dideoxy-N-acetyl-beta-L-altrosamine N-acetyltransferase
MEVRLVSLNREDLETLREWRNSDWLRPYVREYRLLSMVNQRDWLDHISRSREVEMFGVDFYGGLIGVCGLCNVNWVNRTAEISLYIASAHQGKGFASQVLDLLRQRAFGEFNLHRLWAEIFDFNVASIALFQRSGYTLEGRLRQHFLKLGQYRDILIYGLLREEA